jgi:type I restriction enzyme S subunit
MTVRRFKRYPAYKDSGVAWLGEIPAHWEAPKMWRISNATSGGTPAKEERRYWDGDIPWVSPKDMKRRFIDSSEDNITDRAVEETGIKLIEPPVVLIVVRGMILAHTFPVAITTVPVTINQDMKALRFRRTVEPIFATWLLEGVGKGILGAVVEEAAHGTKAIRMDRWRAVGRAATPATRSQEEQNAASDACPRTTTHRPSASAVCQRVEAILPSRRRVAISGVVPTPRKRSSAGQLSVATFLVIVIDTLLADVP